MMYHWNEIKKAYCSDSCVFHTNIDPAFSCQIIPFLYIYFSRNRIFLPLGIARKAIVLVIEIIHVWDLN